jgi:hypothetical protein
VACQLVFQVAPGFLMAALVNANVSEELRRQIREYQYQWNNCGRVKGVEGGSMLARSVQ